MIKVTSIRFAPLALALSLAGCASGPGGGSIYVPMGGGEPSRAPEPPRTAEPEQNSEQEPRVWRKSEEPAVSEPEQPSRTPSYRESGDALPAAAVTLIRDADQRLQQGDSAGAISSLERAQRIAPRSAEVYFKLAEAYVAGDNLGAAEQFTLKGLSLAGNNSSLQRSGWLLLADIRRARGNVAGASQAEDRARAL
ncbi:tetratricopeptide repeat protein [Marinobacter sp. G11]|uniref:tetratricopeptide repeat protein n=1 Tax=Marinobacter sp. G11 TaxID=2903522 RepID=UPI001E378C50|nr:tetratricopeptide repeat protein [Marinobacter sp. G11]MCE0760644.1 tetratricopeptide repeat protein [Marinobacter sp. G11]